VSKAAKALLLTALLLLVSYSHQKTMGLDEVRSHLVSAVSFASEAETLIEYVQQHRATRQYADGHLAYLANEVERSSKELHETLTTVATEEKVEQCRAELDSLANELSAVRLHIDNPDALAVNREHVDEIRLALEQANSSL
jgi:hypothetical protein